MYLEKAGIIKDLQAVEVFHEKYLTKNGTSDDKDCYQNRHGGGVEFGEVN